MIGEYFADLDRRLNSFPLALAVEMETEHVDLDRGYVKAVITFTDGSELHLFEYVILADDDLQKETYRYHYQTREGDLVKRWDNAPHHPEISTFPDHIHVEKEVRPSEDVDLEEILAGIARLIRSG